MPNKIHLTVATIVERDGQFLNGQRDQVWSSGNQSASWPCGAPAKDIQAAPSVKPLKRLAGLLSLTGFLGFLTSFNETSGITYYRLAFAAEPVEFDADARIDPDIDFAL